MKKYLILLELVLTAIGCTARANAQCGVRNRVFVHNSVVAVKEVATVVATPIAVAVPVVTVVAAYGAAYVPPIYAQQSFGYGAQAAQAQYGMQASTATTCEQNVAALLARIEALEKGTPTPPVASPGNPPATPAPAAPLPSAPPPKAILNVPGLFNRSCIQCHASTSVGGPKGKLVLDSGKPLACEQRLEMLRRINLLPTDKDVMPPTKAGHSPVTDQEAAELLEWATKK